MGTRSYIGKDIGNGKYSVIFCQLESYLETTGRLLTEHYNTPEKVDALLALGDICFLGEKIEPDPSLPHDWYGKDYQQDVTLVPFPVSWTVKMKKKQKETQDILSYHTQAAGCSDKARAKASGGRQPIEECGRTGL
ncbi:hypothetical protein ASJ35_17005 [Ruthenibacterium lactatiformans]|uniref:Uncharacterized protein n=1 Tax=Ruthenibacterium lactatiformans TaxID=1550024 RepID=A0A0W7TLW3_9FIRM|nr:hypothetical protein [Ruthenibacterium lactatiformans]KUE74818.1 hypothetical protein ASJ35_17005 [Ruthenibacterium lactatiformans]